MTQMNKLVWKPWELRALHRPEALFAHSQQIIRRSAARGEAWARRMLQESSSEPQHVGEHRASRFGRVRRALAATAVAASFVTLGVSAPTPGKERAVTTDRVEGVTNAPSGFNLFTPPQEKAHPPRRLSPTECVPDGDSIWGMAQERVNKVLGKKAIGRVSMTNIFQTMAADALPEGSNPNVLTGDGCVQLPRERVVRGLYAVSQHPDSNPQLAKAMQQINDQDTLSNALDQRVPIAEIQAAMHRMAA